MDALRMADPGELSFEDLCAVLPTIEGGYLQTDLNYLIGKGYVQWTNQRRNAPWRGRLFSLTPRGLEIAQGLNTDPMLEP